MIMVMVVVMVVVTVIVIVIVIVIVVMMMVSMIIAHLLFNPEPRDCIASDTSKTTELLQCILEPVLQFVWDYQEELVA